MRPLSRVTFWLAGSGTVSVESVGAWGLKRFMLAGRGRFQARLECVRILEKEAGEPRDVSARPWKEPAVSPIKATDEIRWTVLLQQSQGILGQLICLREHCDVGLRHK